MNCEESNAHHYAQKAPSQLSCHYKQTNYVGYRSALVTASNSMCLCKGYFTSVSKRVILLIWHMLFWHVFEGFEREVFTCLSEHHHGNFTAVVSIACWTSEPASVGCGWLDVNSHQVIVGKLPWWAVFCAGRQHNLLKPRRAWCIRCVSIFSIGLLGLAPNWASVMTTSQHWIRDWPGQLSIDQANYQI